MTANETPNEPRHLRPAKPRVEPVNSEAEQAVVGSMILRADARRTVLDYPVESDDFLDPRLRYTFEAIELLHAAGTAVDVMTVAEKLRVAGRLDDVGGKRALIKLTSIGNSFNVAAYCETVGTMAGFRRGIDYAGEVAEACYEADLDRLDRVINGGVDRIVGHLDSGLPREPAKDVLSITERAKIDRKFVVEDLLVPGDRLIVCGGEGSGKTTWLRQFAVQSAAGIHPMTLDDMPPRRVVHFDLQDSDDQSDLEYLWLMEKGYNTRERIRPGMLRIETRRQGFDILNRGDARWFEQRIDGAEIVILGPLYKTFRAQQGKSKHDGATAEEVCAIYDEILTRTGACLLIEAHSPQGIDNDRAHFRPEGAAQWLRWPEFGMSMKKMRLREGETEPRGVLLGRFRGDRDRSRRWPSALYYGTAERAWPWLAPADQVL